MRQQNLQLSQSNSQMLTELYSEKDRLKVLQHELGSKNSLLNAKKLEWKEKAEITCQYTDKQALLFQCLKLLLMLYLWRSSLFISTTLTDKLFQIFSCHSKYFPSSCLLLVEYRLVKIAIYFCFCYPQKNHEGNFCF